QPDTAEVEKSLPIHPEKPGPPPLPIHPGPHVVLAALPVVMERVAYAPQPGKTVVACGADGMIRLGDVQTRQQIGQSSGPPGPAVSGVLYTRQNNRLLSAGADATARLWSLPDFKEQKRFTGHKGRVWSAVFGANDNEILTSGEDGTIRVWDGKSGKQLRE